jgi:Protein of unknown function (DUF1236)
MKSDMKASDKPNADKANADKANADKANADKAKPSTTGQATEQKAAPAAKSGTSEKAAPAAGSSAQGTQAPAAGSSAQGQAGGSATAQSSGAVNLTTEQKSTIRTSVLQSSSAPKVSRSQVNFNISVGTVVPRTVKFVTVPDTIVRIHPAWRGYSYFIVDEEIIIVEPQSLKIVAVLTV